MLRWLGAALILGAGAILGHWGAGRLQKRVKILAGLQQGLLSLEQAINYQSLPLAEALEQAALAAQDSGAVFARAAEILEEGQGYTAGEAWEMALAKSGNMLAAPERGALAWLGSSLGWGDRQGQADSLNLCRQRLLAAEQQARREGEQYGKLWRAGGWGIGAVLVLFLL